MNKLVKDLIWAFSVAMILRFAFGFILGSQYPFVAVMSPSMTHDDVATNNHYIWMAKHGFTTQDIQDLPFHNGFNKGDALILAGAKDVSIGDVVLYINPNLEYPIIHRVVNITEEGYITKGDRNAAPDPWVIKPTWLKGKALFLIPALGWIRVLPTELLYRISNTYPL
ncbi:MAG: signal peptidase I [Candidatus Altiarchaeota archaeon]|nr:signal peptidase I [Candidatus Altiarchaeota archaeon]